MPRHKSPESLYSMCLDDMMDVVDNVCDNIQKEYGTFSDVKCQINVAYISELLFRETSSTIVDDLCERRRLIEDDPEFTVGRDIRIKLALMMHPSMTKFKVDLNCQDECQLPIYDPFWSMQFSILTGLVSVDLTYAACDPVLRVISKTCKQLEEITLVAAIPETCAAGKLCQCTTVISTKGLLRLARCQALKRLVIKSCEQSGNCHVLDDEKIPVQYLLSLPKLVYFPYTALGSLLTKHWNKMAGRVLRLSHMWDCNPLPINIENMVSVCPIMQRLELVRSGEADAELILSAIQRLADLNPPVPELVLRNVPFVGPTLRVLQKMGPNLRALFLSPSETLDSLSLGLIATSCPNLEAMELENLGLESLRHDRKPPDLLLVQLKNLSLTGYDWDPYLILPMCLTYAHSITKLRLRNITTEDLFIGMALEKIIWTNKLDQLTSAKFNGGLLLSKRNLWYFLENCHELKEIFFLSHPGIEENEIHAIQQQITQSNLDLDFNYRSVEHQAEEWGDYNMIF